MITDHSNVIERKLPFARVLTIDLTKAMRSLIAKRGRVLTARVT